MPRALTAAEYRAFVSAMRTYIRKVKIRRALLYPKMVAKQMSPALARVARQVSTFHITIAQAMIGRYRKLHMQMGTHGGMTALAKAEKLELTKLFKLSRTMGGEDELMRALELLALDSHHIVPAASFSRFRAMRKLFTDTDAMPAVLITVLEHRAGIKRLEELVPAGGLGVIISQKSITSELTDVVLAREQKLITALAGATGTAAVAIEKTHAEGLIDDLIGFYTTKTPDLLGSGAGSVHAELLSVRARITALANLTP
ncbi:MAG: hypothetical protein HOP03_06335 [Lysobacter sp.]|nr:hypothetical protein [Lysobacter sp.]